MYGERYIAIVIKAAIKETGMYVTLSHTKIKEMSFDLQGCELKRTFEAV